jgi:hypothetical protein
MTYSEADGPELLAHLEEFGANPMLENILGRAVYTANGTLIGEFGEAPTIAFDDIRRDRPQYLHTDAVRRYDVAGPHNRPMATPMNWYCATMRQAPNAP